VTDTTNPVQNWPTPPTFYCPGKTPPPGAVVKPDERLSWPRTVGLGAQHVIAMFGADGKDVTVGWHLPTLSATFILLIVPSVIALIAENIGVIAGPGCT
jgi:xanthine/uracil permease